MSPLAVGTIGFVLMLALKGLRSPIGVGLGLTGFCGVWYLKGWDTAVYILSTAPVETLSRFTLAVFPLFILMGILAVKAGLADGLFNAANALIGHRRGGLAMASILGCGGVRRRQWLQPFHGGDDGQAGRAADAAVRL